jgi:hypothetical protein
MPRGGSKRGERRGGRTKGTPNKLTASAKQAFALAFDSIGGVEAFAVWATENRTEFYKLYGRLIPTEVNGPNGGELAIVVRYEDAPTQ